MKDHAIIALYQQRNEQAIDETASKYGPYCTTIAYNILDDMQDTEECVNDTWLHTWNAIPPQIPTCLRAFLAKITRNLALNRRKADSRQKRGGNQYVLALEELGECLASSSDPEKEYHAKELGLIISNFLKMLPERERNIFIGRYFFLHSIAEIAERMHLKENYTASILLRIRSKLKIQLQKEGYIV